MAEKKEALEKKDAAQKPAGLIQEIAAKFGMDSTVFWETIKRTIMPTKEGQAIASNEQILAFLTVCKQYDLNPFTREIFAFPSKHGGIIPTVSIDGWIKLVNSHPAYDGMEMKEILEGDKLIAVECTLFRKDRAHQTPMRAYLSEYQRDTEPWKMKRLMLGHKAFKLSGRYTFGFAGLYDEEEADMINITEQTQVIERTMNKTEELKAKLEEKKKEAEKPPEAPPTQQAPEPPPPVPQAQPELYDEPKPPEPDATITEAQAQELISTFREKLIPKEVILKKLTDIGAVAEVEGKGKIPQLRAVKQADQFFFLKKWAQEWKA